MAAPATLGAGSASPATGPAPRDDVLDERTATPVNHDAPSVVIAVSDSPVAPSISSDAQGAGVVGVAPQPPTPATLDFSAVPTSPLPTPASSYIAKRQRSRQVQMRVAIALLVAVILLAGLLIWVLRLGPVGATVQVHTPTTLALSSTAAYVAEARAPSLKAGGNRI